MRTRSSEPAIPALLTGSLMILLASGCNAGPAYSESAASATSPGSSAADAASGAIRERLGPVPEEVDPSAAATLSHTFRAAADKALPAVVFVEVERETDAQTQAMPELFRFFFRDPRGELEMPPQRGAGSGFILNEHGYIATNSHVVSDATHVRVRLLDGREFDADVVATDAATDVAVIRVDTEGEALPVCELGDSDAVHIGDWVLALGSPLGLDFTVTSGIISAKGRQLSARETALEAFLQTDAAINPGNSGGPLVDLMGRVIGINTAIQGAPRFVGYGFAIPINLAQRVVDDLLEYGSVRRPMLGTNVSDVTAVDAEVYGLDHVRGAEINAVRPETPAKEAGLRPGDVIVAVDGEEIANATELTTTLAQYQPGDSVELTYIRDGQQKAVTVELDQFEVDPAAGRQESASRASAEETLGFTVQPLTAELASRLGYSGSDRGVVITQVTPLGAAAAAGVRPGQILLSINGRAVESPRDVGDIAADLEPRDAVSLRLRTPDVQDVIINYRLRP
jgi:serine protease Do